MVLLMAGIRLWDKQLAKRARDVGTLYPICSRFAICSFCGGGYWPVSTPGGLIWKSQWPNLKC